MANFFDQFDQASTPNFFDQFDAPAAPPTRDTQIAPTTTALSREAAARRALALGSPDQPAGSAAPAPQAQPQAPTGSQLAGEYGQAALGAAEAVPATISGLPGDVENMARTVAQPFVGSKISGPGSTYFPTSGEGGYFGPGHLNWIDPQSDPDKAAGFTMAQTLMGLRGFKGGGEPTLPGGGGAPPSGPPGGVLSEAGQAAHDAVTKAIKQAGGNPERLGSKFQDLQENEPVYNSMSSEQQAMVDKLAGVTKRPYSEIVNLMPLAADTIHAGLGTALYPPIKVGRSVLDRLHNSRAFGAAEDLKNSIYNDDPGPSANPGAPGPTDADVYNANQANEKFDQNAQAEQVKDATQYMAARAANQRQAVQQATPLLRKLAQQNPAPQAPPAGPVPPTPQDLVGQARARLRTQGIMDRLFPQPQPEEPPPAPAAPQGPTPGDFFSAEQANNIFDKRATAEQIADAQRFMQARAAAQKLQNPAAAPATNAPAAQAAPAPVAAAPPQAAAPAAAPTPKPPSVPLTPQQLAVRQMSVTPTKLQSLLGIAKLKKGPSGVVKETPAAPPPQAAPAVEPEPFPVAEHANLTPVAVGSLKAQELLDQGGTFRVARAKYEQGVANRNAEQKAMEEDLVKHGLPASDVSGRVQGLDSKTQANQFAAHLSAQHPQAAAFIQKVLQSKERQKKAWKK